MHSAISRALETSVWGITAIAVVDIFPGSGMASFLLRKSVAEGLSALSGTMAGGAHPQPANGHADPGTIDPKV